MKLVSLLVAVLLGALINTSYAGEIPKGKFDFWVGQKIEITGFTMLYVDQDLVRNAGGTVFHKGDPCGAQKGGFLEVMNNTEEQTSFRYLPPERKGEARFTEVGFTCSRHSKVSLAHDELVKAFKNYGLYTNRL